MLFEGPDQALGVPEAHRLDTALDQLMVFEPSVFNFHHLLMPHRLAQGPEILQDKFIVVGLDVVEGFVGDQLARSVFC